MTKEFKLDPKYSVLVCPMKLDVRLNTKVAIKEPFKEAPAKKKI